MPRSTLTPEQEMAQLLPVEADPATARALISAVPFWFHTFLLNSESQIYTPGTARDHRYRVAGLPDDMTGWRVLDVGTSDGFYAFLAERRGAAEVVAIDNAQFCEWAPAGEPVAPWQAFRAIHDLLGSSVRSHTLDAHDVTTLGQTFDFIFCMGVLHRVRDPLGLLDILVEVLAPRGRLLLEAYGYAPSGDVPAIAVHEPNTIYPGDRSALWGFSPLGLTTLGRRAGLTPCAAPITATITGHPRVLMTFEKDAACV